MEQAYKVGKTRAIGVSNFYPDIFIDLSNFIEIQPVINQIETHVFQQQKEACKIMEKYVHKLCLGNHLQKAEIICLQTRLSFQLVRNIINLLLKLR